jgi:aspartokinase
LLHTVEKIGGTSMSEYAAVRDNIILAKGKQEALYQRVFVVSAYGGLTAMVSRVFTVFLPARIATRRGKKRLSPYAREFLPLMKNSLVLLPLGRQRMSLYGSD